MEEFPNQSGRGIFGRRRFLTKDNKFYLLISQVFVNHKMTLTTIKFIPKGVYELSGHFQLRCNIVQKHVHELYPSVISVITL